MSKCYKSCQVCYTLIFYCVVLLSVILTYCGTVMYLMCCILFPSPSIVFITKLPERDVIPCIRTTHSPSACHWPLAYCNALSLSLSPVIVLFWAALQWSAAPQTLSCSVSLMILLVMRSKPLSGVATSLWRKLRPAKSGQRLDLHVHWPRVYNVCDLQPPLRTHNTL